MLLTDSDPIKKNNVNITGNPDSASTLIFAHGFGTDQTAWLPVIEAFKTDHQIILYDNVGAGEALPEAYSPNKYDNLQAYADDLSEICERLDISGATIVAHSVSAMIAILASVENPGYFKKMILIGASPRYRNDTGYVGGFEQTDLDNLYQAMDTNYFAWVSGFSSATMANADRPELAQSFARTLSAIRPDIALAVARVIFQSDCRNEIKKLEKEVLLIQSKEDPAVPLQVAEYLHQHIQNNKLVVVNASGHFPHISAPQQIINAIHPFLN